MWRRTKKDTVGGDTFDLTSLLESRLATESENSPLDSKRKWNLDNFQTRFMADNTVDIKVRAALLLSLSIPHTYTSVLIPSWRGGGEGNEVSLGGLLPKAWKTLMCVSLRIKNAKAQQLLFFQPNAFYLICIQLSGK
jgi:hypothetical protein